ncbi:MAG: aminotransferase class I/II-fold pyridoxal phosphate-dependent enzyme [Gammaproteobacteria bacterium]|nr:aminotransferase class I/II-fold pyridoxal phosphate-dependent enzyme [Gammaproteobacteria bacterium]
MSKPKNRLFGLTAQAKGHLIQQMLNNRLASADRSAAASKKSGRFSFSGSGVPDEFTRFDKFPAYQQLLVHQLAADNLKITNPFFRVHEGIAGAKTVIDGREQINFASYNYLGLCGHPEVSGAAKQAIEQYGTSVSASRPVAGERPPQRELEKALAELHGVDDCVVFVSGHATNVTTIGYLFGPNDLILHDALIHNSVIQGIQLSGAHRMTFAHNDWQALDEILTRSRNEFERVLIVIEGIYSMDGDFPELRQFVEVKKRHKSFLMVDEAHSQGVLGETGRGIGEHFGVCGSDVDIWMGTLSKTLASCGGYIAGESALVEHLKFAAPGFLYSVGISPPLAAAALAALNIMQCEPERVKRLRQRGELFLALAKKSGIKTGHSAGYSVIPALTGSSIKAVKLANALLERGVHVQPIVYPAVEEGMARLRFFMSSAHTEKQIRYAVDVLAKESKKLELPA